jgi:copper transporter 1
LYGATVFLSFFLMLVFMTYNVRLASTPEPPYITDSLPSQAYLILAVVVGAALGHYIFGGHMDLDATSVDAKGMACH